MGKKKNEKTLMDVIREVNEKERLEEEAEEERKAEERRQREEAQKKAYEEQLRRDRIELIKLKEGVISDKDIPREEKAEKHYTIWQRIGNVIYHDKAYIILGLCFIALVVFIVYSIVSADRPDMTVIYIDNDPNMEYLCDDAANVFEPYCEDVNGDGEVMVKMFYVPEELGGDNAANMQLNQSYRTKLIAEFQAGEVIMVIGTERVYKEMGIYGNGLLQDMTELYPDDENATSFGYKVTGTSLAEAMGYEDLREDLYISFRTPQKLIGTSIKEMEENYETALKTFDNYIKENRAD
ncbi:MAG: hypothetical protein MR038_10875 [Oscillospiraceae bacterium]|nr:hypothetical protein [Oscillospiraceae bacterium]